MKTGLVLQLLTLILAVSAAPAMATPISIQLGPLVPTGSCVPTTAINGGACAGPTSVSTFVSGLGTVTISAFSIFPGTPGNISVSLDGNTATQVPYLGVFGGNNDDEIDVQTPEVLQISFSRPVFVTTIDLNKLFTASAFDTNTEVAGVNFLSSACLNFFCGANFYFGTANGLLQINNPFNSPIDALQFWAVPTSSATDASNSDFGVSALTVSPVPEPGTLILLGSGLAALAARRRKRRANS